MTPQVFPRIGQYLDTLHARDSGALMVVVLTLIAVTILIECRWQFPQLLDKASKALLVLYYLSLIAVILIGAQ